MADQKFRIYDLDEQTTPLAGWVVPLSKSGNVDESLDLSKHFYKVDRVEIGTWAMNSTALKNVAISNIANVESFFKISIIDDNGYEYDASAIYDSWIHGALRNLGSSSSKTINVTGSSTADISGSTSTNNIKVPKFLFSGSVAIDGTYTSFLTAIPVIPSSGLETSPAKHFRVNHQMNTTNYTVVVTAKGNINQINLLSNVVYDKDYFRVQFLNSDTNSFEYCAFEFFVYSTTDFDTSHSHSISGNVDVPINASGSTGAIISTSGFAFKSVQIIPRIDRANNRIQLTHNACDNYQSYMTAFGEFTPASNQTIMQQFKNAGNRGYIYLLRKFIEA